MAPTSATYFYMTDQRATDSTRAAPAPSKPSASSTTPAPWRYAR